MSPSAQALVLSGGGRVGTAWMLALLDGLRRGGVDLGEAELIVGTSAGALVGEAVAAGRLARALALHREGALPPLEMPATTSEMMSAAMGAAAGAPDAREATRRIANLPPVGTRLAAEAEIRRLFRAHLADSPSASLSWPAKRLLIAAVDVDSGERAVFDASAGVPLLAAVTASCAVPGIFPPVTIAGRRYVDGGVHSPYNADLAAGSARVVIVSPLPAPLRQPALLQAEVALLRGAQVHQVHADDASQRAIGPDLMSPDAVAAAIEAGSRQAARELPRLRQLWGDQAAEAESLTPTS